jgi:hypothetical protein
MLPVASGQAQGIRLLPVLRRWRLTRENSAADDDVSATIGQQRLSGSHSALTSYGRYLGREPK